MVDVLFDTPGSAAIEHRTPEHTYELGTIGVADEPPEPGPAEAFATLRTNAEMVAERERIAPYLDAPPDKTLGVVAEMDFQAPEGAVVYICPMHPEIVSDEPGKCPKCAMKLMPTSRAASEGAPQEHHAHAEGEEHGHAAGAIEWETTWSR